MLPEKLIQSLNRILIWFEAVSGIKMKFEVISIGFMVAAQNFGLAITTGTTQKNDRVTIIRFLQGSDEFLFDWGFDVEVIFERLNLVGGSYKSRNGLRR